MVLATLYEIIFIGIYRTRVIATREYYSFHVIFGPIFTKQKIRFIMGSIQERVVFKSGF